MKKILFLAAMLLGTVAVHAQSDDYLPIAREGSEWCYEGIAPDDDYQYMVYRFEGDTIADGRYYKILNRYDKLLCTNPDGSYYLKDHDGWIHYALVHEEGKKVYARCCSDRTTGALSLPGSDGLECVKYDDGTREALVYDFNDICQYFYDVNEIYKGLIPPDWQYTDLITPIEDECVLNGKQCYKLGQSLMYQYVVEGIGQFSKDVFRNANLVLHRPSVGTYGYLDRGNLVYMKNPQGEFEYLDVEKYALIKDAGTVSAVIDVKVPARPADSRYYNLMGQPVAHPENAPGIYIHNGKKVVVK